MVVVERFEKLVFERVTEVLAREVAPAEEAVLRRDRRIVSTGMAVEEMLAREAGAHLLERGVPPVPARR